MEGENKSFL